MRSQWSRALLLSVFVAVAAVGFVLSRPGWLLEDNSPVRNTIEALSWVSGIAGVVGAGTATSWRWLRTGHSGSGGSGSEGLTTPTVLVGRALHLLEGRIPTVSEVSLLELGVKPAMDTDSDADLPPFVQRDQDGDIEWSIAQGGMVLLHGQAASGKTRAAIEALRRLRPHHDLLVPCDGTALRELVQSGCNLSNTVIWLDEFERYLMPGGLDLAILHRLSLESEYVTIVATIRDEELSHYDYASTADPDGVSNINRNAVEVVERVRARQRIRLNRHLSEEERKSAVQQPDHRILTAVTVEEGFAEYLVAGRAMFGRWSLGDGELFHLGQALISAAIDCRRAGYNHPISEEILKTLHVLYLAPGWRHRSDLPSTAAGLNWACKRVSGASSCLQPRAEGKYRAADYLVDSVETRGSPLAGSIIPMETWNAVLSLADTRDAYSIGVAAYYSHNNTSIAERAFKIGLEVGDTESMRALGVLKEQEGLMNEAEDWVRQGADRGNAGAITLLGRIVERQGRVNEAEIWYRKGAGHGNSAAMGLFGLLRLRQGRPKDAEYWYRRSAEHEDSTAMLSLGVLLHKQGRVSEAENWYRKSAQYDNAPAMRYLGILYFQRGRQDWAEYWCRRAIELGSSTAIGLLAIILHDQGRTEGAEAIYRSGANQGDSTAMGLLGGLLEQEGRPDEAEIWLRKGAGDNDYIAMYFLGLLFHRREKREEAQYWYHEAVKNGSKGALERLNELDRELCVGSEGGHAED